jgi:phosphonoacetate hydrolase
VNHRNFLFAKVQGQMPAVTNTNNAGICRGVPASKHGISGNSYLNLETGREDFREDAARTTAASHPLPVPKLSI